jgi:[phosphatase 2A protein]-leucine-carboxy methyltransferase
MYADKDSSLLHQSRDMKPNIAKYVEIDFPSVTSVKARRICMNKTLSSALSPPTTDGPPPKPAISQGGSRLDTPLYTLLPLDLRTPKEPQRDHSASATSYQDPLSDKLLNLLDPNLPTLFLAECVYCYMQPEESERIIKWFADQFGDQGGCVGIMFDMCGLE